MEHLSCKLRQRLVWRRDKGMRMNLSEIHVLQSHFQGLHLQVHRAGIEQWLAGKVV